MLVSYLQEKWHDNHFYIYFKASTIALKCYFCFKAKWQSFCIWFQNLFQMLVDEDSRWRIQDGGFMKNSISKYYKFKGEVIDHQASQKEDIFWKLGEKVPSHSDN